MTSSTPGEKSRGPVLIVEKAAALGIAGYFDKATDLDTLLGLVERYCRRN